MEKKEGLLLIYISAQGMIFNRRSKALVIVGPSSSPKFVFVVGTLSAQNLWNLELEPIESGLFVGRHL